MNNDINQVIIYNLLQNEQPLSTKKLATLCDISINTLRKQITNLNLTLKPNGLQIISRQALGCYLLIEDEDLANIYINRFKYNNKRKQYNIANENYRANYIIRRLLTVDNYLPITKLSKELFYSTSSINRDLRYIKQLLKNFNLEVKVKRNQGISISGDEWNKRICIIYQQKIFVRLNKKLMNKEKTFTNLLLTNDSAHFTIRNEFINILKDYPNFQFSYINIPKLSNYLVLAKTRYHLTNKIVVSTDQIESLINDEAYRLAEATFTRLRSFFDFDASEKDLLSFAMMLIAYRSLNSIDQIETSESSALIVEAKTIFDHLSAQYHYLQGIFDLDHQKELAGCLYIMKRQLLYHTPIDSETFYPLKGISTFSLELCMEYTKYLEAKYQITIGQGQALLPLFLFENIVSDLFIKNLNLNILLISIYGINYSNYIAKRLNNLHHEMINHIEIKEAIDLVDLNFEAYDLFLTDINPKQIVDTKIPLISIDRLQTFSQTLLLNTYLKETTKLHMKQLLKDHQYQVTCQNKTDMFNIIASTLFFNDEINKQTFIKDLILRETHLGAERANHIVLISTYHYQFTNNLVYIFINDKPIIWDDHKVQMVVFYYYDHQILNSAYELDTLIKILLSKNQEELKALFNRTIKIDDLIDYKY